MTFSPLFPFAPGGLDSLHPSGAVRAVFGAVRTGEKIAAAHTAPFSVQSVEQGCFQFLVQRQHRRPKPPAQQGVGNALDTDTFLSIVQRKAVAAIVIAALMHQPPRPAVLPVVHDGNFFTLRRCHSAHNSGTLAAALV